MIYSFESFELDTDSYRLSRTGDPISVEPKVFDFLHMLVEASGRVFTRDEIIDRVWQGRIVSDATVSTCVKAARKALGDDGQRQAIIRTVHGRGFSLAVEVAPVKPVAPQQPARAPYVQPAIIVPPTDFADASPEAAVAARGLSDAIRVALGRVPFAHVLSRRAAADLASKSIDDIRSEVGQGYILDLALRGTDPVTVHAELVFTGDGRTIWSRGADLPAGPGLKERLVAEILPQMEPALVAANLEALRQGPKDAPDPRALVIEAFGVTALIGWNAEAFGIAERLIREALHVDPDLALAHALLSLILALGQRVGFEDRTEVRIAEAIHHAEQAMSLAPVDSICLGLAGCALADAGHTDRALPILEKSVQLNPVNAHAHAALGSAFLQKGDTRLAVDHLERGIALSPHDSRIAVWGAIFAQAKFMNGDVEDGLNTAERAVAADDKTYLGRIVLAGLRLAAGQTEMARAALQDCKRLNPDLSERDIAPLVVREAGAALAGLLD